MQQLASDKDKVLKPYSLSSTDVPDRRQLAVKVNRSSLLAKQTHFGDAFPPRAFLNFGDQGGYYLFVLQKRLAADDVDSASAAPTRTNRSVVASSHRSCETIGRSKISHLLRKNWHAAVPGFTCYSSNSQTQADPLPVYTPAITKPLRPSAHRRRSSIAAATCTAR